MLVKGLYANLCKVGYGAVKVFLGVHYNVCKGIHVVGFVGRGQYPLGSENEVVGGNVGILIQLAVIPLHALAQVECPNKTIVRGFPAGRKAGLHNAVLVILYQRVNKVGRGLEVYGGARRQIVQRRYLRRIQIAEGSVLYIGAFLCRLTGCLRSIGVSGCVVIVCLLGFIGIGGSIGLAANYAEDHHQAKHDSKNLLHLGFPLCFIIFLRESRKTLNSPIMWCFTRSAFINTMLIKLYKAYHARLILSIQRANSFAANFITGCDFLLSYGILCA